MRMVRREQRGATRRLGLHAVSIAVGVAALVAINSFRANLADSVRGQAREILGADLELRRGSPLPPSVDSLLDSAAATGVTVSRRTTFASMALAPRSGRTRLVQTIATDGRYPYYGGVETSPAGSWSALADPHKVLVDPAVLIELDVRVGDSLKVGDVTFQIAGSVTNYPGRVSLQTAIGPRVYLPLAALPATNLIRRGSRASYLASLRIGNPADVRRFLYRNRELLRSEQVRHETVDETEDDLTEAFDTFTRFLGLVGLAALLLGGVGVASAIHVYVRSRLDAVALLRCLGASGMTVTAIYLVQAAVLGLLGAAAGTVLGVAVQLTLPHVLGQFLPLDVAVRLHPPAILQGLLLGTVAAVVFALLPLLPVRRVPPLRTLRRELEPVTRRGDPVRLAVAGGLVALIVALCLWQAPNTPTGLGFAGAIAATALVLWVAARTMMGLTRRLFPHSATYAVRQGVANLFRPRNQTLAVTLALGFGVFLISVLLVVQHTLLRQFRVDFRPDRPNLVLFDIQTDQRDGVRALLTSHHLPILQETPIVPARLYAINDLTVEQILNTPGNYVYHRWALRREYRHTYRDTLVGSETLLAGEWWDSRRNRGAEGQREGGVGAGTERQSSGAAGQREARASGAAPAQPSVGPPVRRSAGPLPRISIEEGIAQDLHVTIGDRLTWNVQGALIETRVASIRRVNWARFEPNFFVVFEPGVLEDAPQMAVILTRSTDVAVRAVVQRDLVERFPNVATVDLTLLQRTLDTIVGKVTLAIRFMALFSVASGILILVAALATSRHQRLKEVTLLRTLGAAARQVRTVLLTEYAALGFLAGLTGAGLAAVAGWAVSRWVFEIPYRVPWLGLLAFWVGSAALTTIVGAATGRELARKPPLDVLRSLAE
jgi:putative ABC transport system permease protein